MIWIGNHTSLIFILILILILIFTHCTLFHQVVKSVHIRFIIFVIKSKNQALTKVVQRVTTKQLVKFGFFYTRIIRHCPDLNNYYISYSLP